MGVKRKYLAVVAEDANDRHETNVRTSILFISANLSVTKILSS